ncbi:DNA topoisomerase [Thoreauomyces humboldtii]|nr:DNA topoisomerase [Thoreauomyces humboldtii]
MKLFCVAEKPSIAKSVAHLLSNGHVTVRNTKNKYIKNYCFSHDLNGQRCDVVMSAVMGHLMESDFTPEYKNWKSIPCVHLFDARIVHAVKKDLRGVEDNLINEARKADMLVIWTDCDLEGEAIGSEVASVCRGANPRIRVKRARFSVIQKRELTESWHRLGELDMRQAAAVEARSEMDLRIGAVFTRFQTLMLRAEVPEIGDKKIVSYGSCQFPTLGFIVERYLAQMRFVPEPFWRLEVYIRRDGGLAKFDWARTRLFDHYATVVLYAKCVEAPRATVVSLTTKLKTKWAPLPLTTVEMQKAASRLLKMTSDRVMKVAEDLYNRGIISYPRTETDIFADTFELRPLVEAQTQDPNWGGYAQSLLGGKFKTPRKGQHDDQAHPPIHPVRGATDLQGDEKRVYEYITRRFLACCSDMAKGNETVATIDIAGERFVTKGLAITERNYLEVYVYDKWSNQTIPNFVQGEHIMPTEIKMAEGSTTQPDLLTEADLIGLMEKSGIGTDATIHEHIKKIQERDYCNKEGAFFVPTVLGMGIICGYEEMSLDLSLHKPYLRSLMERAMKGICAGSRTKADVVQESVDMYRDAFLRAKAQSNTLKQVVAKYVRGEDDEPAVQPPRNVPAPNGHGPGPGHGGGGGTGFNGNGRPPPPPAPVPSAPQQPHRQLGSGGRSDHHHHAGAVRSPPRSHSPVRTRNTLPNQERGGANSAGHNYGNDNRGGSFGGGSGGGGGGSGTRPPPPGEHNGGMNSSGSYREFGVNGSSGDGRGFGAQGRGQSGGGNYGNYDSIGNGGGGGNSTGGSYHIGTLARANSSGSGFGGGGGSRNPVQPGANNYGGGHGSGGNNSGRGGYHNDNTSNNFYQRQQNASTGHGSNREHDPPSSGTHNTLDNYGFTLSDFAGLDDIDSESNSYPPALLPHRTNAGTSTHASALRPRSAARPRTTPRETSNGQWQDQRPRTSSTRRSGQPLVQMDFTAVDPNVVDKRPRCECKLVAVVKTSRKKNENEGRDFYTCVKAGTKCGFFQWADEVDV